MTERAVITGASSGIGEALARHLASQGVNLVIAARRADHLRRLASELSLKYDISVEVFPVDLTEEKGAENLFAYSVQDGKKVDLLINNAGIGPYRHFIKTDLQEHLKVINLNMNSLTILSHLFAVHMLKEKRTGYILNVSSVASYSPFPRFAVYGASKSYVRYFSETLNYELQGTNVSVSCLCPGGTMTEFLEKNNQKLKTREGLLMSSEEVARIAIKGTLSKKPIIIPGFFNKAACLLNTLLPSALIMKLTELIMTKAVHEKS